MTIGAKRKAQRSGNSARASADTQSQEAMRVRARRRLIGAVALVLLGVVLFPLVFESKPKPVPTNIALDVPAPAKVGSLALPASQPEPAAPASTVVSRPAAATPAAEPPQIAEPAPVERPAARPVAQPAPVPAPSTAKPAIVVAPKPEPSAKVAVPSGAVKNARQALAALEGKQPEQISVEQAKAALRAKTVPQEEAVPSKERYVVQAGAYADSHAAQEVRAKIAKAGLQTYTQVIDTPHGKRIRVRVGPFNDREAAEKALERVKKLGLSAVVLTL